MTITAKFQGTCHECNQPIAVGDKIEYRKGEKATHASCFKRYFEVAAGGGKIGIFATTLDEAKAEAARLVEVGCDAESCNNNSCSKEHYHDINCRCADCFAAEDEVGDDY